MNQYQEVIDEACRTLLSKENRGKATKQIQDGVEIVSVDGEEVSFRLFNSGANTSNLEMRLTTRAGTFFKPVGYYKPGGEIVVLREFEKPLTEVMRKGSVEKVPVKKMSDEANVVAAAFSVDTLLLALQRQETEYTANGVQLELITNYNGDPQVWSPDYSEAVGIYELRNEMVNPTVRFAKMFERLSELSLLSAFKSL